jgi:hypothetical protein
MTVTDNQKAVLAEHQAADKAVVEAADAEERETLGSLLGHTIVEAEFNKTGYGGYTLTLDDGRTVVFGGSPFIEMSVTTL